MERLKLNQSQIGQFMRCPEQWRRVNVEKDRIPPAFAMIRGTATHKGAEVNFAQKVASKVDLPKADIVEASVATVGATVRNEGVLLTEDEKTVGLAKLQNDTESKVRLFAEVYAEAIAPRYQPTEVELKTEIEVDEGLSLHGRADWIEGKKLVDLKTGSASFWNQETADHSIQFTMYALLFQALKGEPPAEIAVELIADKKAPENSTFVTSRGREDFLALMEQAKAVEKAIRAGAIVGAYGQGGAWWCSRKSCGFWGTCKFVPAHRR